MAAFSTVLSLVSRNPNHSAVATNSRNFSTTASQFDKIRV
jgi:hypothetical protein